MLQKAFIPRVPGKVEVVLSSQQPEGKERSCVLVQAVTRYNTHTAIPSGKNKHNERVCVSDASKCVCAGVLLLLSLRVAYIFSFGSSPYLSYSYQTARKKNLSRKKYSFALLSEEKTLVVPRGVQYGAM